MAGFEVNRGLLDQRAAEAVLALRDACRSVEVIAAFLATVPSDAAEGDRLTLPISPSLGEDGEPTSPSGFGYSEDEAYLLRVTFETLEAARLSLTSTLNNARRLTGLN